MVLSQHVQPTRKEQVTALRTASVHTKARLMTDAFFPPSPSDTTRQFHPFAKTTPGKNYHSIFSTWVGGLKHCDHWDKRGKFRPENLLPRGQRCSLVSRLDLPDGLLREASQNMAKNVNLAQSKKWGQVCQKTDIDFGSSIASRSSCLSAAQRGFATPWKLRNSTEKQTYLPKWRRRYLKVACFSGEKARNPH